MSNPKTPKSSITLANPFTINDDVTKGGGMPSISRLLDRRKLSAEPPYSSSAKTMLLSVPTPVASTHDPVLELRPEVQKTDVKDSARSGLGFKEITLAEVSEFAVQLDSGGSTAEPQNKVTSHNFNPLPPISSEMHNGLEVDPGKTQLVASPVTAPSKKGPPLTPPQKASLSAIKPAKQRLAPNLPIKAQNKESIANASDPLAMTLKKLLENGAFSVLVLHATETEASAVLAFEAGAREAVWEGLKWNSVLIGATLWAEIQKTGALEIPPMLPAVPTAGGRFTTPANPRGVLRRGLGAEKTEWLTFLSMESTSLGKTILAVFSKSSIQTMLPQIKYWLKPTKTTPSSRAA